MLWQILLEKRLGIEVQRSADVDGLDKRQKSLACFVLADERLVLLERGGKCGLREATLSTSLAEQSPQMFLVIRVPVVLHVCQYRICLTRIPNQDILCA